MSRLNLAALAATVCLTFVPSTALASSSSANGEPARPSSESGVFGDTSSASGALTRGASRDAPTARITAPKALSTPAAGSTQRATKNLRVQIGATTGVIYLNRTETRQIGQGGAWVVAGAIGAALAPSTAGLGTIAAIAVGVALGSVGSKLIDQQLAAGQCLKVSVPWISLGTVAKLGWAPCTA